MTGSSNASSSSIGGALSVDNASSIFSEISISDCNFYKCIAQGEKRGSNVVRGGAVAVARAASTVVRNSKFRNCQIKDASSATCGGAGISAILVLNLSIDDCEFIPEKHSSKESASTSLLVLAPSLTISRVQVARSKFEAHWAAAVNALCVGDDGIKSIRCPNLTQ
jgi:hypothetical protein